MKKFFISLCFAFGVFFLSKTDAFAFEPILHYEDYYNPNRALDIYIESSDPDQKFAFVKHPTLTTSYLGTLYPNYVLVSNKNTPIKVSYDGINVDYTISYNSSFSFNYDGVAYYSFSRTTEPKLFYDHTPTQNIWTSLIGEFDTVSPSIFNRIVKSDVINPFGGDGFNINGSLNGNTVDVFKCNPFRLLSTDYMYYEVSIKSLKQFSGSKAIVKLIGDRSTYSHTVTNPFLVSFDTIPVDDYVSVNSDFYMVCTPIDSNDNYGNSIVYKYRLTQDGIVSVYDEPIDTPKGLNVDINNNYLPVTQINKNRAFVTNIDYSTITYNSMNVEYLNTWDIYYSPNISTSNDNISIQNITDSYNTYNYVTNNYNDLTFGLGLNFDFGDNDISDDGNVIDTLDDIKVLLSFLPWLLGLFTFIPSGFVTIILGGFSILLVVVIVKIFK